MKNIIKSLAVTALTFGAVLAGQAQQIPVLNQYIYNPMIYNPSRTGIEKDGHLNLGFRRQWANMPFSPTTGTATFDLPLRKTNVGLGLILFVDKTHLTNNIGAALAYAYHLKLSENSRLSMGMTAGATNQRFDFRQSVLWDQGDAATLGSSVGSAVIDLAAGVNYRYKTFDIGFSIPQLIQNDAKYRNNNVTSDVRYQFSRHYLANASYLFGKPEKVTVKPNVMMRYVAGLPVQFDATVLANWKETAWAGVGYRSANTFQNTAGLNFTMGVAIKKQYAISYSVEMLLNKLDQSSFGLTHEILVSYKFPGLATRVEKMEEDQRLEREANEQRQAALLYKLDSLDKNIDAGDKKLNTIEKDMDQLNQDLKNRTQKLEEELQKVKEDLLKLGKAGAQKPEEAPAYTRLGTVYFAKNSYALNATATAQLDAIVTLLKSKSEDRGLYLGGYASEEGSAAYNLELSEKRSAAIAQYLQSKGVKLVIVPIAYGEVNYENTDTDEKRKFNRRVDLFLNAGK